MPRKTLDELLGANSAEEEVDNKNEFGDEDFDYSLPREASTREAEEEYKYVPPSHLPEIQVGHDYVARWVRVSMTGQADAANFAARNQEGWTPIDPAEDPNLARRCGFHKSDDSNSSLIQIGGLVACKMPKKMAQAREDYYEAKARMAFSQHVESDMSNASSSKLKFETDERKFTSSRSLDG
jgi:hypothetical protein